MKDPFVIYPTGKIVNLTYSVPVPGSRGVFTDTFYNAVVDSEGLNFGSGLGEDSLTSVVGRSGTLEANFVVGATGSARALAFLLPGVNVYSLYLGIALNSNNLPYVIGKNNFGTTVFESIPSLAPNVGALTPTLQASLGYDPVRWSPVAQTVTVTGFPAVQGPFALPSYTTTWTVGTIGGPNDFPDLATALASGTVLNGHRLLLKGQTFTVGTTITVNKSVTIEGAGLSTILTTAATGADPLTVLNITVSNVVLKNLTIKQKKTTNTSIETAIDISAGAGSSGHFLENVIVETMEFGVVVRSDGWQINNCHLAYVGPNNTTRRLVAIYRSDGTGIISNTTYNSGQDGVVTGNTRVIVVTTSTSPPSEVLGGYLRVTNVKPSNAYPVHQFFNIDYFAPSGTPLSLCIDNCVANEQSAFVVFAQGATQPPFTQSTYISMFNNVLTNAHGKGMLALNGSGALANPGTTTFYAANNSITNPISGSFQSGVTAVSGALGNGTSVKVTLKWSVDVPFSDGTFVQWYINDLLMPSSSWQTAPTSTWVPFVGNVLLRGLAGISGLNSFNGILQGVQLSLKVLVK